MVKINAEDRSIMAMLPTNSMVQLMQLCVDNGRRFRKLRKALQPEMEEATKDSQLCASKIKDLQSNIRRVEVILKAQGASAGHTLKNDRTQWRAEYKQAREHRAQLDSKMMIWTGQLKSLEGDWIKSMRKMSDEHGGVLVDCGMAESEESLNGRMQTTNTSSATVRNSQKSPMDARKARL
jgi:hypothetical protein